LTSNGRFLKTAEALQVKGLAQHPFLSTSSGEEEEEEEVEEEEEEEPCSAGQDLSMRSRAAAWPQPQAKPCFKQVGTTNWWKQQTGGHNQLVEITNRWAQPAGGHNKQVGTTIWWA